VLSEDTSALPRRLKELRQELGWSLEDLAQAIQAGSKGVISNWEATTDRQRIPPLGTLLALARWYGVSLDYLVGLPGAERDSPGVRLGKAALRERFPLEAGRLELSTPATRLRLCMEILQETAPEAFFTTRIAAQLLLTEERFQSMVETGNIPDSTLQRFASVVGIPVSWFFVRVEDL